MQLRPYQVDAAHKLARGDAVGLWVAAGLGKTLTILHAWEQDPRTPALILTKAIGRHVWGRDAEKLFGAQHTVAVLWGGKPRTKSGRHEDGTYSSLEEAFKDSQIIVSNYEVLKPRYNEFIKVPWKYLIFDEAHALKMGYLADKKRRDGSIILNRWHYAKGLADAAHAHGATVWELTATPQPNLPRDLWGQLRLVQPRLFASKWQFLRRYCNARRGEFGWLTDGATHVEELERVTREFFVCVKRSDVADQLPALQRDIRVLAPRPVGYRLYGGGVETAVARAAASKAEDCVTLALEYLTDGCKVVLVTSRRKTAGALYEDLYRACTPKAGRLPKAQRDRLLLVHVDGSTSPQKRVQITQQVNDYDGPAALVATSDSLTESIDLHYMHALIVAALPYTPAKLIQLEGRVARLGGVPSTIHYLVADQTIDMHIRRILLDKLEMVEQTGTDTQGDRGSLTVLQNLKREDEILENLRQWLQENEPEENGKETQDG